MSGGLTPPADLVTLVSDARPTHDRHHHHSVAHATYRVRLHRPLRRAISRFLGDFRPEGVMRRAVAHKIGVIGGDGIGPEVVAEAL
ncbi:MAG: hypothetical protein QOD38_2415 [Acidimicrobiaceae bacterium]